MILRYPWMLLLLLLIPLLVWLRHGRRKAAVTFSDMRLLERIPAGWRVSLARGWPIVYAAGLILLVIALARPQLGLDESRVRTEGVDIVLLADVSTSMRALDFSTPTRRRDRLAAAQEVMRAFISQRPNDRIGLIAFSAMPYTLAPLTLDHGWLVSQIDRLKTGMLEDGTAIGDAMISAVNRLRDSKAKSKVVVLLTDGMQNAGKQTPADAARAAEALGVKIYTVGAGREGVVPFPQTDPFGREFMARIESHIDESVLRMVAQTTGASYFRAENMRELSGVYRDIDRMEKTEMQVENYTRYEERFQPWLAAGLLLLGLERWLAMTRLGRLP